MEHPAPSYTCQHLKAPRDIASKAYVMSPSPRMEEVQISKRRRLHSSEPNAVVYTNFPSKYVGYLLLALLQDTSCENKDQELQKKVRFEVDMALVLSTREFSWSRALKHKLDQGMNTTSLSLEVVHSGIAGGRFDRLRPPSQPCIPRPLFPVGKAGMIKREKQREDEKLRCRVRMLRRILPGGMEMSVWELLSEVETYVVCLQMQVKILRTLVDTQS